jgi:hypothetical protein
MQKRSYKYGKNNIHLKLSDFKIRTNFWVKLKTLKVNLIILGVIIYAIY